MGDVTSQTIHPRQNARISKLIIPLILLVVLQALLFLPLYAAKYAEGHFLPDLDRFWTRDNPDIFRWSLDYALLFIIILMGYRLKKISVLTLLLSLGFLLLFLFQSYYFISWKIYGEKPVWTYDWALILRVLPVFMRTMKISPPIFYTICGLSLLLILILVYRIHRFILNAIHSVNPVYFITTISLVFILPYFLSEIIHTRSLKNYPVIHWITRDMVWTFTGSRVKSLPEIGDKPVYNNYYDLDLKTKPNICLIFIEAYGSIAGAVPPYQDLYWNRLKSMDSSLAGNGWYAASALSNSTILGGRSWLGFTTLLSGLRIDNHPAYEKLIREHTGYPHLIRILNHMGYHTYRLNTMANFGMSFEKLDSIAIQFYANKTWTKYSDLPYQGFRYDYFGGIPDQFALNYWDETVLNKQQQPYFLFFITLNTHAPFYLPPPLLDNWKDLNSIKTSPHSTTRAEEGAPVYRYVQDVVYNLSFLEKYILEKADSNTLFILIGDHQPAGMEYLLGAKTDTYATPLHIITRDGRWTEALKKKGFQSGMLPVFKTGSLLKHEGFYSLFMQTWSEVDSLPATRIPAYLPNGLQ